MIISAMGGVPAVLWSVDAVRWRIGGVTDHAVSAENSGQYADQRADIGSYELRDWGAATGWLGGRYAGPGHRQPATGRGDHGEPCQCPQ